MYPWKSCIGKYGCTLYNLTSRLATGHRSAQRPYGAPKEGGAMENGWKQVGKRSGDETDESLHLQWRADFMLSDKQSGQSEETLRACECVPPCCVSLYNPECVGVIGSVGLRRWKASNVFVWSGGRISSRQFRAVIPVLFFHSFHLLLPSSLPRSLVRFLSSLLLLFCLHNCERKLNHSARETDLYWSYI